MSASKSMPGYLETCEQAARLGGRVLLDHWQRIEAREKAPKDLVTDADLASQRGIRQMVLERYPAHGFVGEEEPPVEVPDGSEFRWIVDPLDGTTNYVHGLANFAVSVALEHRDEIIAGVVYDPVAEECFAAGRGGGATRNGEPIQTSSCRVLRQAMVAASFSANVERHSIEIARFVEVLLEAQTVRRLGSAALNLCYVAAGRLDAYWAASVKLWDVAAGWLILREAGGLITALDGAPLDLRHPRLAAAATPELHRELLNVLARSG